VARKQLEAGDGAVFKPDFNKRQIGAKIWILVTIGFDKLMQHGEFRSDDPELISIANYAKQHAFEIKAATGVTISQTDSPMAIAQNIVGLIGYRFPLLRREGGKGNQVRIYGAAAADFLRDDEGKIIINDQGQAIPFVDGRDEVFAAWLEKDTASQTAAAAAAAVEQKEGGVHCAGQNVSEFDTVVRGNKDLDLIEADYRGGVTTEGLSTLERLCESFRHCETPRDFALVLEGFQATSEQIQDAIALQDNQPRRQQLTQWFEQGQLPAAIPSEAAAYSLGQPVKVRLEGWVNWLEGKISRILEGVKANMRVSITQPGYWQSKEVGVFSWEVIVPV
jgi:hypothetical protein